MAPELVFLHIPKTAGSSLRHSFRRYYGHDQVFWIGDDCPATVRRYPSGLVGDRLVLGGHKPLSFYPRQFDPLYCALLRDPVERAISLFVYYTKPELATDQQARRVRERVLARLLKRGIDPGSMLRSIRRCRDFRREISNAQCAYISRARHTFKGALNSLQRRDFLLGTFSQYSCFHERLGTLLNWPGETPGVVNRSDGDYAAPYLADTELVALLRELNAEDEKLLACVEREYDGLYMHLRNPAQRQQRLRRLPLQPWWHRDARHNWKPIAGRLWPAREGAALPWPLDHVLLSEANRLLYLGVPGLANAQAQRLMLSCSSVQHQDAILRLGLPRVLARFETGLALADQGEARARSILADDRYFRFALVSEPVARLVAVYVEKFVLRRDAQTPGSFLESFVAAVQGVETADRNDGISFREFVTAVLARPPQGQHHLWAPQHRYLQDFPGCDKLYRQDQLQLLVADLNRLRGVAVNVPGTAAAPGTAPAIAGEGVVSGGDYADCRPSRLPRDVSAWRHRLVDRALCEQILDYYARDCELYNRTAGNETEVHNP